MTPAERRYRRVLRLLPAGYRQLWEEDMVGAYLDSVADSPRRSVGEWLSVAWLALRLRLNGSRPTPRAQLWYQMVLGIAMLTTLYESLSATLRFAYFIGYNAKVEVAATGQNQVGFWSDVLLLMWVPTFICLVLGRLAAARVLVLATLAHGFGLTSLIVVHTISPDSSVVPAYEPSIVHSAWLGLTAVAIFLVPSTFYPSRGWLAAYIVPALVTIPLTVAAVPDAEGPSPQWLQLLQLLNVGFLLHLGMIIGMVVALVRARQWLAPLAAFGGGVAVVQLLGSNYGIDMLYERRQQGAQLWTWVNIGQLVLAVVCAIAAFVVVRRARTAA